MRINSPESSVSPVVGIAVLVAVAVVLSAIVFATTTGFMTEQQAPSAGANVTIVSESIIEVQLDSVQNADNVYVKSTLGTRYKLEEVGDSVEILNIGNQQKPVVIAEKDGKEHVVQGITPRSFDADTVVAKDGSGNYTSLQNAIDNAQSGETIAVKRGVYDGTNISQNNIKVVAEPEATITGQITAGASETTVSNFNMESDVTISGDNNEFLSNSIESTVTDEGDGNKIIGETNNLLIETDSGTTENTAPSPEFSFSPDTPKTIDSVFFDASASSDSDGFLTFYEWDFNNDGATDATGETVSHEFSSSGTYTVQLTVKDNYGVTQSTTKEIQVQNTAPTAEFTFSPQSPTTTDPVSFNADSSTDSDGSISSYEWDFNGDGTVDKTGKTVSNIFNSSDYYNVSLTVTDDEGATDSVVKQIPVYNAEQQSKTTRINDGETLNVQMEGDIPARDIKFGVTPAAVGVTDTVTGTWSGSDPTVTVDGVLPPESQQLVLNSKETSTDRSISGSGTGTEQVDIGGNSNATNGQITVIGNSTQTQRTDSGSYNGWQVRIYNGGNQTTTANIQIEGKSGWVNKYKISKSTNSGDFKGKTKTISEGGRYKLKLYAACKSKWSSSARAQLRGSTNKSVYVSDGSNSKTSKSKSTKVNVNSGDELRVRVYDFGSTSEDWAKARAALKEKQKTGVVTLSNSNDWAQTNHLRNGETDTVNFKLEPGWNDINVNTSGYDEFDWEANYTEISGTSDPSVSIDGTQIWSKSGGFDGQETIDVQSSRLDPGQTDFQFNTNNGDVDYEISWTEHNKTQDPSVSINNENVWSKSGVFSGTKTIDLGQTLQTGEQTIDIETSSGKLGYEIQWAEVYEPDSVEVTRDGQTVWTHSKPLPDSPEVAENEVPVGEHQYTFNLTGDGALDVTAYWTELRMEG